MTIRYHEVDPVYCCYHSDARRRLFEASPASELPGLKTFAERQFRLGREILGEGLIEAFEAAFDQFSNPEDLSFLPGAVDFSEVRDEWVEAFAGTTLVTYFVGWAQLLRMARAKDIDLDFEQTRFVESGKSIMFGLGDIQDGVITPQGAIEYLESTRANTYIDEAFYTQLTGQARAYSFTAWNLVERDVRRVLDEALDPAIRGEIGLQEFHDRVVDEMDVRYRSGGENVAPWHSQVIYRTNLTTAYVHGEMDAIVDLQDIFTHYSYVNPSPVADICQELAGRTVPTDWAERDGLIPPLHFNCMTYIEPLLASEVSGPVSTSPPSESPQIYRGESFGKYVPGKLSTPPTSGG